MPFITLACVEIQSLSDAIKNKGAGIIPRLDKSGELGSIYRWRDGNAKSGNSYWYYVNLVMQNGDKRSFTSPQKVLAK